jgi:hypothetical protein
MPALSPIAGHRSRYMGYNPVPNLTRETGEGCVWEKNHAGTGGGQPRVLARYIPTARSISSKEQTP